MIIINNNDNFTFKTIKIKINYWVNIFFNKKIGLFYY